MNSGCSDFAPFEEASRSVVVRASRGQVFRYSRAAFAKFDDMIQVEVPPAPASIPREGIGISTDASLPEKNFPPRLRVREAPSGNWRAFVSRRIAPIIFAG